MPLKTATGAEPGLTRASAAQSRPPMWMSVVQGLEPSLALPRVGISRVLHLRVEPGFNLGMF